jgi:CelD/BcsL family acetyltransferase involved in cellulose biosynthesis
VHQWEAIAAMPSLGLRVYDLGPGGEHWKRTFANQQAIVHAGLLTAASPIGRLSAAQERVWTSAGVRRIEAVGRLRRRLDQIAAMELTFGGRVRGLVSALAGFDRRSAARRQPAAV